MNTAILDFYQRIDPPLNTWSVEHENWFVINSLATYFLSDEYAANHCSWQNVFTDIQNVLFEDMSIIDSCSWSAGLWDKYPNVNRFAVTPEAYANGYFTVDGVLFKHTDEGVELVSVPPSRKGKYLIPAGVTQIAAEVFCQTLLHEVVLPETLQQIDSRAFFRCNKIETLHIPASVKQISQDGWGNGFVECTNLQSVTVDPSNANFYSENGVLYRADGLLLCYPDGLSGPFTVPDKCFGFANHTFSSSRITQIIFHPETTFYYIGTHVFYNCQELTEFRFPTSMKTIGFYTFLNCTHLTDVYITNDEFKLPDTQGIFDGCHNVKLHVCSGSNAENFA